MSETEFIDEPIQYLNKVILSDIGLNTFVLFISMIGYVYDYCNVNEQEPGSPQVEVQQVNSSSISAGGSQPSVSGSPQAGTSNPPFDTYLTNTFGDADDQSHPLVVPIAKFLWYGSPVVFYVLGIVMFFAFVPAFSTFMTIYHDKKWKKTRANKNSYILLWCVFALYFIRFIASIVLMFFHMKDPNENIDRQVSPKLQPIYIKWSLMLYLILNFFTIIMGNIFVTQITVA